MAKPDEFLVNASRDGDHDAYAELVRRHLKRVFAICLSLLGELADAEDAAQEVFVRGYERIHSLRDGGRFSSWIDQIARNRCRDLLRGRLRRPDHPLTAIVEETAAAPVEEFGDLRTALSRLPEEHRLPLLLYYYDGKDTRALAQEMGLTQGGACARLYRARRLLRRLLEEEATSHE
jgi:RNA polymerase sigma-70 factor (ECF subfamily)